MLSGCSHLSYCISALPAETQQNAPFDCIVTDGHFPVDSVHKILPPSDGPAGLRSSASVLQLYGTALSGLGAQRKEEQMEPGSAVGMDHTSLR